MLKRLENYLLDLRDRQRMVLSVAKGNAGMLARTVNATDPHSWEFSGFSQNGEDGILQVLRQHLRQPNRHFVEIGAADGLENNSGWLAVAEKYNGVMIDGNPALIERAQRLIGNFNIGVQCKAMFVTRETVAEVKALARHPNPDVFSLDIDGNDYYIARDLLDAGLRPKIWAVEYNSAYGPTRSTTIAYSEKFWFKGAHPTHLYYGVSVMGWRNFFASRGYRFVSVDRHGVNAFFVDPSQFDAAFLEALNGVDFVENAYQFHKFKDGHEAQFGLVADKAYYSIPASAG